MIERTWQAGHDIHPDSYQPTPEEFAAGALAGDDLPVGTPVWIRDWVHWDAELVKGVYRWLPAIVEDEPGPREGWVEVLVLNTDAPDEHRVQVPLRFSEE